MAKSTENSTIAQVEDLYPIDKLGNIIKPGAMTDHGTVKMIEILIDEHGGVVYLKCSNGLEVPHLVTVREEFTLRDHIMNFADQLTSGGDIDELADELLETIKLYKEVERAWQ